MSLSPRQAILSALEKSSSSSKEKEQNALLSEAMRVVNKVLSNLRDNLHDARILGDADNITAIENELEYWRKEKAELILDIKRSQE